ncbi:MAG: response regulator [Opitutales bacterium]|jgi:CheY-like chemotaxis protein|nr:response regulator [Opitutales bacterium]
MAKSAQPILVHIADDDEDDRLLCKEAFEEGRVLIELTFSVDGMDLLDYLRRDGKYEYLKEERLPDLILLDLNMPRMNGYEALAEIKADPKFRRIPTVVMTTSTAQKDVLATYDLGANSFISKPVSFSELVKIVARMTDYWVETVRLPHD